MSNIILRYRSFVSVNTTNHKIPMSLSYVTYIAGKEQFFIKISSVTVTKSDLVTFTEEILNGKLNFLSSDMKSRLVLF